MIKGSIQEEDITLINIHAPNTETSKYIKQIITDIKGEIDNNTIILGDFNIPFTSMDRSSIQKINKATVLLNDTIDWLDLIDIYSTFHLQTKEYKLFSSAHGTFSRIDHMLGQKASLNKFKRIEITRSIFSNQNGIKLEINKRKKNQRRTNTWKQNNMLLKNQWSMKKPKRKSGIS